MPASTTSGPLRTLDTLSDQERPAARWQELPYRRHGAPLETSPGEIRVDLAFHAGQGAGAITPPDRRCQQDAHENPAPSSAQGGDDTADLTDISVKPCAIALASP